MHPTRRALFPLLLLPLPARAESFGPAILMARLATISERRATFREERTLAALTTPLVSTGRLLYRRPDYLEKDTLWPLRERLVIDGSRLVITDPASNDPPHVVPLDVQPELRALVDSMRAPLAGDLPALRHAFALAITGTLAAWTLDLTPTDPGVAKVLTSMHLTGQDTWIDNIRTIQANGDITSLQITPA